MIDLSDRLWVFESEREDCPTIKAFWGQKEKGEVKLLPKNKGGEHKS